MLYTQIDPPVSFMRINGQEENIKLTIITRHASKIPKMAQSGLPQNYK